MEINDLTRDDGRMNSTIRPHAKPGARPFRNYHGSSHTTNNRKGGHERKGIETGTGGLEGLGDGFLSGSVIAVPEASTGSAGRGVAVAGYTGRSTWNGRRLQRGHSRPPGFCSRARTARTASMITAANRACSEGRAPEVARHLVSSAVVVLRMTDLLCAFRRRQVRPDTPVVVWAQLLACDGPSRNALHIGAPHCGNWPASRLPLPDFACRTSDGLGERSHAAHGLDCFGDRLVAHAHKCSTATRICGATLSFYLNSIAT